MLDLAQAHFQAKIEQKEQNKLYINEAIDNHIKMKQKKEKRVQKRREKYALEVKLKDQLDCERSNLNTVRQKLTEVQNQIEVK